MRTSESDFIQLFVDAIIEHRDGIIQNNARLVDGITFEQAKFNAGRIVAFDQVLELIQEVVRTMNGEDKEPTP